MAEFCAQAWDETAELRRAIHALPFNRELAAGTLSHERFSFYIQQDAAYLGQFARVLAIAAAKAPNTETLHRFMHFALGAITVEQALHERYLIAFGISRADPASTEPAPDCLAYTSFLLAAAYHEPWEVLIAALLPCFRLYWDVGQAIAGHAAADNPYRDWIDTYSDQSFGDAVLALMTIVNHAAETTSRNVRQSMLHAHRRATQYEFLFWEGAYQRRDWPLAPTTQS